MQAYKLANNDIDLVFGEDNYIKEVLLNGAHFYGISDCVHAGEGLSKTLTDFPAKQYITDQELTINTVCRYYPNGCDNSKGECKKMLNSVVHKLDNFVSNDLAPFNPINFLTIEEEYLGATGHCFDQKPKDHMLGGSVPPSYQNCTCSPY